tara:strand:- start:779 stop:1051 length:273 start_codon:yes stop_codon:yes gene_type:complete
MKLRGMIKMVLDKIDMPIITTERIGTDLKAMNFTQRLTLYSHHYEHPDCRVVKWYNVRSGKGYVKRKTELIKMRNKITSERVLKIYRGEK